MANRNILAKINPFDDIDRFLDRKTQEKAAAVAAVSAAAVLREVPILDDLFDGKRVLIAIGAFSLFGGMFNFPGFNIPIQLVREVE